MNPELEVLNLPQLVAKLRDVHTMRTPLGWPTDSAVTKSSVERRIFEIVVRDPSREGHDDPAERIHCDVPIKLRTANRPSAKSDTLDLRPGGVFVETDSPFTVGEPVEIEVETDNNYKLKVTGNVGFVSQRKDGQASGVGVVFQSVVGDSSERRLQRMVLELLRNRVER